MNAMSSVKEWKQKDFYLFKCNPKYLKKELIKMSKRIGAIIEPYTLTFLNYENVHLLKVYMVGGAVGWDLFREYHLF